MPITKNENIGLPGSGHQPSAPDSYRGHKLIDPFVHLLFFILGAFAFIFFEERLFSDAGYYLFHVINRETFLIECTRYILVFEELPALLAVKAGLGLKAVVIINSLGYILFFYGIFLIGRYVYKDHTAGPLLLLLQTLGIMSGFFTPVFELYQAAGLLVLMSSILWTDPGKPLNIVLLLILSFFILTAHQFAYTLFIFMLALHALDHRKTFWKHYLMFVAAMIAVYVFKQYNITPYEISKMDEFKQALYAWDFDLQYVRELFRFLFRYYLETLFIFAVSVSFFIYRKKYLLCFLIIAAFTGMLLIVNLANHGFVQTRYQEQVYFPLTFIAAFPFCMYVMRNASTEVKKYMYFLTLLIILYRLSLIHNDAARFTERTLQMKRLIAHSRSLGGSKFSVGVPNVNHPYSASPYWSYPVETMFLSSMKDQQHSITICTSEDMNFNGNHAKLTEEQYLFRRWEIYDISTLNQNYFRINRGAYIPLNNKCIFSDSAGLEIKVLNNPYSVRSNSIYKLPVQLINNSGQPVCSHEESGNYFSYRWLINGKPVGSGNLKTLPETDIYNEYSQNIMIRSHNVPGECSLIIDFISPTEKWSTDPMYVEVIIR
jgi:hypothetical protein